MKKGMQWLRIVGLMLALATLACSALVTSTETPGAAPTVYLAPTVPVPASPTSVPAVATLPPVTVPPPVIPVTAAPAATSSPEVQNPTTGALVDFENWGSWRRGDQANGTFEQSNEQVHGGQFAGKLAYSFATSGNDFVVFVHPVPVSGTPDRMRAWVYGDGEGHFLNVWIRDAEGEVWQSTFGRVEHTGWQRMTAEVGVGQDWPWGHVSGPDNGAVDYPIEFYALALDDGDDPYTGDGTLFVDEITAP